MTQQEISDDLTGWIECLREVKLYIQNHFDRDASRHEMHSTIDKLSLAGADITRDRLVKYAMEGVNSE